MEGIESDSRITSDLACLGKLLLIFKVSPALNKDVIEEPIDFGGLKLPDVTPIADIKIQTQRFERRGNAVGLAVFTKNQDALPGARRQSSATLPNVLGIFVLIQNFYLLRWPVRPHERPVGKPAEVGSQEAPREFRKPHRAQRDL